MARASLSLARSTGPGVRATPGPARALAAVLAAAAWSFAGEAAASEPQPLPQQTMLNAEWIEHLRPEDLAPTRAVVCLVDSGIAETPDTGEGVIARNNLFAGEPGTPGPLPEHQHGTYMAAAMIGRRNGWGAVGLHPLGRVLSVRALKDDETRFPPDRYQQTLSQCEAPLAEGNRVVVVNLSLGSTREADETDRAMTGETIARLSDDGVATIAAAGNEPGSGRAWPSSARGATSVAAASARGHELCAYASFDAGVDFAGPGCGVAEPELASGGWAVSDTAGSSTATALVSASVAVLCDLRADLTGVAAVDVLRRTARQSGALRIPDVEAAARAIGRGDVVEAARARAAAPIVAPGPAPIGSPAAPNTEPAPATRRLGLAGRARARWSRGRLTVALPAPPSGATTRIQVFARRGEFLRRVAARRTRSRRVVLRLGRRPAFVRLRAESLAPGVEPSAERLVRVRS